MRSSQLAVAAFTLFALATMSSSICFAHPGHGGHGELESGFGLVSGLFHPFFGFNDILALIAVALLAVRLGGRCLWALPFALVGTLVLNGVGPALGVAIPGVSVPVLVSIVLLRALVVKSRALSFDRSL